VTKGIPGSLAALILAACTATPLLKLPRADAAYSVDLGDRTLWLFGDTLLEGRMPRNTIAIQRGDTLDHRPVEFFKPPDGRGWFWPWAGFMKDGTLYVFLNQFEEAGRTDMWNFKFVKTWLAVSRDPAALKFEYVPSPDHWGVAVVVAGDTAYIYGRQEQAWRMATAKRVEDFASWEIGEPLFDGAPEGSVSRLGDRFVAVYTEGGMSPNIVMRTAAAPGGPWSEPKTVYVCPEAGGNLFTYAAKAHPQLGELVISYAVNSRRSSRTCRACMARASSGTQSPRGCPPSQPRRRNKTTNPSATSPIRRSENG
jgi:hypothetical protein